jgi:hypothetical protein
VPDAPYLTPAQLRASVTAVVDEAKYPDATLADLVAEFEWVAEDYRGVAFTPRTTTETVRYDAAMPVVVLKWAKVRTITTVTADGTAITAGNYTVDLANGTLAWYAVGGTSSNRFAVADVVVAYDHGYDQPPPLVLRACRQYVRSCALADLSGMPRDVIGQSIDGGYTRYSTPDKAADRLLNSLPDLRAGVA